MVEWSWQDEFAREAEADSGLDLWRQSRAARRAAREERAWARASREVREELRRNVEVGAGIIKP